MPHMKRKQYDLLSSKQDFQACPHTLQKCGGHVFTMQRVLQTIGQLPVTLPSSLLVSGAWRNGKTNADWKKIAGDYATRLQGLLTTTRALSLIPC